MKKQKAPDLSKALSLLTWTRLGSNQGPPDYGSVPLWFRMISNGLKHLFTGALLIFNIL